jgi:hypothetical protein
MNADVPAAASSSAPRPATVSVLVLRLVPVAAFAVLVVESGAAASKRAAG